MRQHHKRRCCETPRDRQAMAIFARCCRVIYFPSWLVRWLDSASQPSLLERMDGEQFGLVSPKIGQHPPAMLKPRRQQSPLAVFIISRAIALSLAVVVMVPPATNAAPPRKVAMVEGITEYRFDNGLREVMTHLADAMADIVFAQHLPRGTGHAVLLRLAR